MSCQRPLIYFSVILILVSNISCVPNSVFVPVTRLIARVGSFIVFDCDLEFPSGNDSPIPYILNWRKDVSTIKSSINISSTIFFL